MNTSTETRRTAAQRVLTLQKRLSQRWRTSKAYTRTGRTKLCVDGPPRSANSLLMRKLRMADPTFTHPAWAVSHHTHDPDSVLLAALSGIPVIMPLRARQDALASFAVYHGRDGLEPACQLSLRMCEIALGHPRAVVVASFETILNDANALFRFVNRRFGLGLADLTLTDEVANRRIAAHASQVASRAHGDKWESKMGVPSEDRQLAKDAALQRLKDEPLMEDCQDLFRRVNLRCAVI